MKIGISAFAWTSVVQARHLRLLPGVRSYGFEVFEVPMSAPEDLPVAALRRGFEAAGLECTVCAILPPGINPISPEAATRKRSRQHLAECIETAAELGAGLLGGPLLAPFGYLPRHRPTEDEWKWAVEIFQSLGELLESYAISLTIEPANRHETFFIRTAAEAKAFCAEISDRLIGVTLDTFHAHIEEKNVPAAIRNLGFYLRHVHLSENDRGPLGTGQVDFPKILRALRETGYEGCLMIEGFGFSAEEPLAPGALWADTKVSPEELARTSLAYLKGMFLEAEA